MSSSEDDVKRILEEWLVPRGWKVRIAWGHDPGTDIVATRNHERWLIEVKGEGSRNAMRVNYFLGALGEILQRMEDPTAKYSIAFPDLQQFRNLWKKLPSLARTRIGVTALFVSESREVAEVP